MLPRLPDVCPRYANPRGGLALRLGLGTLMCALGSGPAAASEPGRLGVGWRAVPGFYRVPVVAAAPLGVLFAGGVSYGFTEGQIDAPGAHHRLHGRMAAGVTPVSWLDLSMGTNLRHDRHADDELGTDDGTVLDSDLHLQAGGKLGGDFHVGAGLGAGFVRGESAARSLANPALDLHLLAAFLPRHSPFSLGALAGFRYDLSARAVGDPDTYRAGDRLALGLSEFNAVPLGVGGRYRFGATEVIAEISGDILVGAGAPGFTESPSRATVGARHWLGDMLALRVVTDTALSARPATGPSDPLSPIEPRFQVLVGMTYDVLDWAPAPEVAPALPPLRRPAPLPAAPKEALPPAVASLQVNVTTLEGHALSDATVELVMGTTPVAVPHDHLQSYRASELSLGKATLRVSAARLKTHSQSIELRAETPLIVDVRLEPAPPTGQLRGLVRSFGGKGLQARVRIEPLGTELATDQAGTFLADVLPGRYVVVIHAPGHQSQRRQVEVTPDGVVILNADLLKAGP